MSCVKDLCNLSLKLHSLAIFRTLLSDPVLAALLHFLDLRREDADTVNTVDAYAAFVSALYTHAGTDTWGKYLQNLVFDHENVYVRAVGQGKTPAPALQQTLQAELNALQETASLTAAALTAGLGDNLPAFDNAPASITADYAKRVAAIRVLGYGMYAKYHMFYVDNGVITPVKHPDPVTLDDLIDYRREQEIILDNTRALLQGKPAANILLTGDAGTGKSSTVKAVANALYTQGLRILEVRKDQLRSIPALLDELSANPLKFILFIDDLSFTGNDDNYSALKAILEGSVSAKSSNVAIYATSNRRHLMRESFADREGDDVHHNDTMQEMLSLSERFGIQLTFQRPDKATYLDIVEHLAAAKGIQMSKEELALGAERFALGRGGRSARAAKQYVDSLIANM